MSSPVWMKEHMWDTQAWISRYIHVPFREEKKTFIIVS